MKFLLFYRIALIAIVAVSSPLILSASEGLDIDKPVRRVWVKAALPMFQDSTATRKKQKPSSKPPEVQKPPQNDQDGRLREIPRRSIKQVPRSIPKLKPQPVTEQGQIQRPPLKGRRN